MTIQNTKYPAENDEDENPYGSNCVLALTFEDGLPTDLSDYNHEPAMAYFAVQGVAAYQGDYGLNCLNSTNADRRLSYPAHECFQFDQGNWAWSAWVNFGTPNSYNTIMGMTYYINSSNHVMMNLDYQSSGLLSFYYQVNNATRIWAGEYSAPMHTGHSQWDHVAVIWEASTGYCRLYLNEALMYTDTDTVPTFDHTLYRFNIGCEQYFSGDNWCYQAAAYIENVFVFSGGDLKTVAELAAL